MPAWEQNLFARISINCKKSANLLYKLSLLCYFILMKEIKELFDKINELQQVIDLESDTANEGCIRSQQLIINAEQEKEIVQEQIDALALCLAFA